MHAYACRQAHVYETLTISFVNRWRGLLVAHGLGTAWLRQYPVAVDPLSSQLSRGHPKLKSPEFNNIPTRDPSLPTNPPSSSTTIPQPDFPQPGSSATALSPHADTSVDPPLDSDEESDSGSEYFINEDEGLDFDD